jgi:hypothetical protein
MTNLAEYISGTDPNEGNSFLRIRSIAAGESSSGIEITWGASAARLYTLERSQDLSAGFTPIAEHILASPPTNRFLDPTATGPGPYFYRIRIE